MAVSEPDAVFSGLKRPNQHGGLAYSVRPEYDPDDDEEERAAAGMPRYGEGFLAFAEVRDMGYVVFDWTWRTEDPDLIGHPENWRDDFANRVRP